MYVSWGLRNLCTLNCQYGNTGNNTSEALFVIEAYRTLCDRGPRESSLGNTGSAVMSDVYAKSFAPLPTGSMFHSETGLKSFEHPKNNTKAMLMVDREGVTCGANFKVDARTKINAIPRRGIEANWALANTR
ncbi:hypothetical protein Bca101_077723 [Brassica carinata]